MSFHLREWFQRLREYFSGGVTDFASAARALLIVARFAAKWPLTPFLDDPVVADTRTRPVGARLRTMIEPRKTPRIRVI